MERFDVIVIGSGSGMIVASAAVEQGFRTALVEHGKMGGTCINVGCVPSKMLIYPADVVATLKDAGKLGINATVDSVDFNNIMTRMHTLVNHDSGHQARAVEATPNLTWFKETGEFISDYTMQVGSHTITAEMIFIVSGARTAIPPIKGIENIGYLTSDTVLELQTLPKSILIVGGGYIGMEYGHFFSGIGTKTTILQRPYRVLPDEEPEISDLLKKEMQQRMEIYTGYEAIEAKQEGTQKALIARNRQDGSQKEFSAESVMIATGRVSNADILKPEKTGVELDERGYIKVNEYLETSKKNIWAFGDAIGIQMFKHVANYEAGVVWHNAIHDHKVKMDFSAAPHAVFTHPQVASVGLTEEEAKQQNYKILVGKALYKETAMGAAMGFPEGFVKVIVEKETGKILGGHIIGAEASILIQEIVNAMITETGNFAPIARAMHIHPAMSEVVQNAFGNLIPA
ncbi:MAG: dihydrolipoyl dehydrogenase [Candidatus Bathyarchaeota archaeon]|nr:dihydrolipoyl dehydrogenase [Candidatus Bathyarchaeota archaeon]